MGAGIDYALSVGGTPTDDEVADAFVEWAEAFYTAWPSAQCAYVDDALALAWTQGVSATVRIYNFATEGASA